VSRSNETRYGQDTGFAVGLSVGLLVGFVAAVLLIVPESNFRAL
jgi:hypothetical protein